MLKKNKLKFCLVVDAESDFYYAIPSPDMSYFDLIKWKINNILGKLYKYPRGREGIVNLVKLLKDYKFPTNFAFVGHLYLKKCHGWPHFSEKKPKAKWFRIMTGQSWYDFDPCSNYIKHPGFYLGDFIESEMKKPYFKFGLHSFSHEAYLTESKDMVESSINAGISAANSLKIRPIVYDGPWNMVEDFNRPKELLQILEKKGFKWIFQAGKNDGLLSTGHKLGLDKLRKYKKLKIIRITRALDGTSHKKKFEQVIKEIKENIEKDRVYCLSIHDFTWKKKGIKKLEKIIRFVKKLESQGFIETLN